jgi:hypothetical protein
MYTWWSEGDDDILFYIKYSSSTKKLPGARIKPDSPRKISYSGVGMAGGVVRTPSHLPVARLSLRGKQK